jgi:flagellar assembly protein FliH
MSSSTDVRSTLGARVVRADQSAAPPPAPGDAPFRAVTDLPVVESDAHSGRNLTLDPIRKAAWVAGEREGRAAGHAAGYEAGHAAGRAAGHAEGVRAGTTEAREATAATVERAVAALGAAVDDLARRDAVALTDIEGQVVDLALELAAAVLQREVAASDDPGRDALARALALAPDRGPVLARLHPDDLAALGDDAVEVEAPGRDVRLVADPAVDPGGCRLEVGPCRVDATITAALARAREVLEA